jgi:carbamoyl-phosphate synthase small subunit
VPPKGQVRGSNPLRGAKKGDGSHLKNGLYGYQKGIFMKTSPTAIFALSDGTLFQGISAGVNGFTIGEIVFNTAMTGYQEIITDPSYCGQMITFSCPHIGNVGINSEDVESKKIWAEGLIFREITPVTSNWRSQTSLHNYLIDNNKIAIANIDTRALIHHLRDQGWQHGCIMAGEIDPAFAIQKAREYQGLSGLDLAQHVSTLTPYTWLHGKWHPQAGYREYTPDELPYHVVVYDFGVKYTMLRKLVDQGCRLTVVPARTPASEVIALKPQGVFLSNGPGDPAACDYAIQATREILDHNIPLFAICLGHQLLALACGAETEKMSVGHHGGNHPVLDIKRHCVSISSQNHGFTVVENTLPKCLEITHRSLFDQSIEGLAHVEKPAFSFQGHPEASPGPHDLSYLFQKFAELMK